MNECLHIFRRNKRKQCAKFDFCDVNRREAIMVSAVQTRYVALLIMATLQAFFFRPQRGINSHTEFSVVLKQKYIRRYEKSTKRQNFVLQNDPTVSVLI